MKPSHIAKTKEGRIMFGWLEGSMFLEQFKKGEKQRYYSLNRLKRCEEI